MLNNHVLAESNIKKLLIKLSLPAMTGMLVMALYNFVDTIYVGRGVGPLGIAGLSIVFPIQMIILAIGQLLGIGSASVISRSLGEGDTEKANFVLGTVYTLNLIVSFIITGLCLIFTHELLYLFGTTDTIYPYAKDYYQIIIFATVLFVTAISSNNILRAEGRAKAAMVTMLIGFGLNIILDPVFIFALKMGVRGAALATVISQFIAVIYVIMFLQSKKSSLKLRFEHLRLNFKLLKQVFAIGLPSFIKSIAASIIFIVINNSLRIYSVSVASADIAIASYGIVMRLLRFLVMPLFGLAQGMQPIAGFNYGAKRYKKVSEVFMLALFYSTLIAIGSFVIVQLFSRLLVNIFTDDPDLIETGSHALRIMMLALPVVGIHFVSTLYFQALGKVLPSLVLSMTRELLLLIPLVIIMPVFMGINGVWLATPVADFTAALITLFLVCKLNSELNSMIDHKELQKIVQ